MQRAETRAKELGYNRCAPARRASGLSALQRRRHDIRAVLRRDYGYHLRRTLGVERLRVMVSAARSIWPRLNQEPIPLMSDRRLRQISAALGLNLRAAPYTGRGGLGLRGFYVREMEPALKRPMIYLNTAHHPLAVLTTFGHEIGHHLNAEIDNRKVANFFFDLDYSTHLDDPAELAADVVVSLGGYPKAAARRIFPTGRNGDDSVRAGRLPEEALYETQAHLARFYGLELSIPQLTEKNLQYLAGIIHYAKLRWGLLAEYDV